MTSSRDTRADDHAASSWNLERIVSELRARRTASQQSPEPRATAEKLPSWRAVLDILDGLRAALFPTHFGEPELTDEGVDYFVGHTLDKTLGTLLEQVRRELRCTARREGRGGDGVEAHALEIVQQFAARLSAVRALLESDLTAADRGDPAAKNIDEILFCYPGVAAIIHYRLAHVLYRLGTPLLARMISEVAHSRTAVDIHPAAEIGGSFFIDHGTGVVIGETTVVGERVRLYQAVTLGARSFAIDEHGALVKGIPRHPIVEDDVVVYAGATILGRITIGRGSTIGGNVWLTKSVPPGSNITQAQVRTDVFDGGAGI